MPRGSPWAAKRSGSRRSDGAPRGARRGQPARHEPREREKRRQDTQAAGVGSQREHGSPQSRSRRRAPPVALELGARVLDQLVVLDAGRAGGHAGHAAEAVVDVLDQRSRELAALLEARPHQHDPTARGVHLLAPQRVGRAGGQAEAAVHAVVDQLGLRRPDVVERGRHAGGQDAGGIEAPLDAVHQPARRARLAGPTRSPAPRAVRRAPRTAMAPAPRAGARPPRPSRPASGPRAARRRCPSGARPTTRAPRPPAAASRSDSCVWRPDTRTTVPSSRALAGALQLPDRVVLVHQGRGQALGSHQVGCRRGLVLRGGTGEARQQRAVAAAEAQVQALVLERGMGEDAARPGRGGPGRRSTRRR